MHEVADSARTREMRKRGKTAKLTEVDFCDYVRVRRKRRRREERRRGGMRRDEAGDPSLKRSVGEWVPQLASLFI